MQKKWLQEFLYLIHIYDNNGHNEDAEKLKKEIEEKENELLEKQETKQEDNKKEEKKEENKQNTNESEVEEKLKEIQKEVIKERQNKMERTEKMQNYTYYPGKKLSLIHICFCCRS